MLPLFKQKKSLSIVFAGLFLVLFLQTNGMATYLNNFSDCAFEPNCGGRPSPVVGTMSISFIDPNSIPGLIRTGAGYFLDSLSGILQLSNKIEMADIKGLNYVEIQLIVNSALYNLTQARNTYITLCDLVNKTEYNEVFITNLMSFNYTQLQQDKKLNSIIFAEVQSFLSNGDLRGLYAFTQARIQGILDRLITVKGIIDTCMTPPVDELWRLNQSAAELQIFGQYSSEICYNNQL